jgi:6-phosphogluconolactonase
MARPGAMSVKVEVWPESEYALRAARRIAMRLPELGAVVITGGTTAEKVYRKIEEEGTDWSGVDVLFSDERAVPPDHEASNYRMATDTLLSSARPRATHRMRGEDPPEEAARAYASEIAPFVAESIDVAILGMGEDCHVCALFPGSPALTVNEMCAGVDRPDGMKGITLTPVTLRACKQILVIVTGEGKSEAVRRAVKGDEDPSTCPARVLADLKTTFLLDEPAAALV